MGRLPVSISLLLAANVAHAATVISQVHNAPGWQPSHSYTFGDAPFTRVNNGPGWSPTTGYSAGKTVDAYQLISPGTCVSGASGGPVGAGDAIADGTCTWRYVSRVDYVSLTGWAFDNAPWVAGSYGGAGYVRVGTKIYSLASPSCNSTVAPTSTGSPAIVVTSDGCQWNYWTDIIYSSNVSYIPTQTYTAGDVNTRTYHITADYQANLWNDREYVAGENGERQVMGPQAHVDVTNDFDGGESGGFPCGPCHRIIITAAPGESFADRLTQDAPLTGYDPSKGVALRNAKAAGFYGVYSNSGLQPRDNFVDIIGLQIKSEHGAAVDFQEVHSNNNTVQRSILDGAGIYFVVEFDAGPSVLANSLVISHGYSGGVWSKYPDLILHSTIVDVSGNPGTVGIGEFWRWVYDPIKIFDTAVFGVRPCDRAYDGDRCVLGSHQLEAQCDGFGRHRQCGHDQPRERRNDAGRPAARRDLFHPEGGGVHGLGHGLVHSQDLAAVRRGGCVRAGRGVLPVRAQRGQLSLFYHLQLRQPESHRPGASPGRSGQYRGVVASHFCPTDTGSAGKECCRREFRSRTRSGRSRSRHQRRRR